MAYFFDISTLITLYAALIAILTGLIYIGKPNLLIIIQKELIHELSEDYKQWMEKAERYTITLIPLIPIAAFIWSAYGVFRDEKQKFDHLKNLVIDFEKFRLEESLRQKKK